MGLLQVDHDVAGRGGVRADESGLPSGPPLADSPPLFLLCLTDFRNASTFTTARHRCFCPAGTVARIGRRQVQEASIPPRATMEKARRQRAVTPVRLPSLERIV